PEDLLELHAVDLVLEVLVGLLLVRQHDRPDLVEPLLLVLLELLVARSRGGDDGESENEANLRRRAAGHALGSLSEDRDSISVRPGGTRAIPASIVLVYGLHAGKSVAGHGCPPPDRKRTRLN